MEKDAARSPQNADHADGADSTFFLILVFAFTFGLYMFQFWLQVSVKLYIGVIVMHKPHQLGM